MEDVPTRDYETDRAAVCSALVGWIPDAIYRYEKREAFYLDEKEKRAISFEIERLLRDFALGGIEAVPCNSVEEALREELEDQNIEPDDNPDREPNIF